MRRFFIPVLMITIMLVAACQPVEDETLPTLAPSPTDIPTEAPTDTPVPTETPTETLTPTPTPTNEPSPTRRPTQTLTFTPTHTDIPEEPTATPQATENPARAVQASATAEFIEAPRFATFTPVPPGVSGAVVRRPTSTGTPLVAADVVITQPQFQEEINRLIASNNNVQEAIINFSAGRINVELTAVVNGISVRGNMHVAFDMMATTNINNVLRVQPGSVEEMSLVGGSPVPDGFIEVAYTDMTPIVGEAFSFILDQRLGEGLHDLEFLTIDDDSIDIFLVVPAPAGT